MGYLLSRAYLLMHMCVRIVLGRKRADHLLHCVGWDSASEWYGSIWSTLRLRPICRVRRIWGFAYFRLYELADLVVFRPDYEPAVTNIIERSKGEVFIDMGAHIGRYSMVAARNFKRVTAIEPHPDNFRILKYNSSQYRNVLCVQAAVGDFNGQDRLYLRPDSRHSLKFRSRRATLVSVTRLGKILDSMGTGNIDLIKVDVEGSERQILEDAASIMPNVRAWIVQVHDEAKSAYIQQLLTDQGYKTKWIDENCLYAYRNSG